MRLTITYILLLITPVLSTAQQTMSPEMLWSLGRVSAVGISEDQTGFVYKVTTPDIEENSFTTETFLIDFRTGSSSKIESADAYVGDKNVSEDGKWKLMTKKVHVMDFKSTDRYPDLEKSDAYVYDDLHYRHWDTWQDGSFNHLFLQSTDRRKEIDLMEGEPYHCPTQPFGGSEDYTWSPDGRTVVYVAKKSFGKEYVNSTNTDLYAYNLDMDNTRNLTEGNAGYDTSPLFSGSGQLAFLSMKRDGYESDKNDIKCFIDGKIANLTEGWDGTVNSFIWSEEGDKIYFTAPTMGTNQLFEIEIPAKPEKKTEVKQITDGQFDVSGLVGFADGDLIAGRMDMNRAKEYYRINFSAGEMDQLTRVNDLTYSQLKTGKVESRMIETTDGKEMLTWIIYPPDFDPDKKYPTLLYTQGGPQSALSQFYSFRWNFQIMAAHGYIVVAPNRRGMPGYGVEWNEQISGDWGGKNMRDYISAADALAKEPFVDESRMGCVGASYGGYSAYFLAGNHDGRFKTFIAHDGVFNLQSMYGTTEELFFVNWDVGGPYWDKSNAKAQKSYTEFNPANFVSNWDTPMLIIQGGKDYRVPIGQGLEAFTAAQQKGIKSRLLYFPDENHWVLKPQNGLVWQKEFFKWLSETL
ncbi:MAG: prolyl oligopeptidase family serine peptidase [Cryomorphaceae bacterium]|nr:S9 family peptidase [Flavobacteriales bacterium]